MTNQAANRFVTLRSHAISAAVDMGAMQTFSINHTGYHITGSPSMFHVDTGWIIHCYVHRDTSVKVIGGRSISIALWCFLTSTPPSVQCRHQPAKRDTSCRRSSLSVFLSLLLLFLLSSSSSSSSSSSASSSSITRVTILVVFVIVIISINSITWDNYRASMVQ